MKRIANHLAVKLPAHIEIDDLIQVGLIGLLKAKEDYQSDSGATFSTYATIRIRGAMMDELRAQRLASKISAKKTWDELPPHFREQSSDWDEPQRIVRSL